MDLQSLFYVSAILYMWIGLIALIALVVGVVRIYQSVTHIRDTVQSKVEHLVQMKKSEIVGAAASAATTVVVDKVKKAFHRRKKE